MRLPLCGICGMRAGPKYPSSQSTKRMTMTSWSTRDSLWLQYRNTIHRGRFRDRQQKGIDIGELLVRHDLGGIRRHFVDRLADLTGERRKRNRLRSQPGPGSAAVRRVVMTLIAAITREDLLAIFSISSGCSRLA